MIKRVGSAPKLPILLSSLIAAGLVGLGWSTFDWDQVFEIFSAADYVYVVLCVPLMWGVIFLRFVRLCVVTNIWDLALLRTAAEHNLWNSIIPFRLGELSLVFLLKTRFSLTVTQGGVCLVLVRICDFINLLMLLILSLSIMDSRLMNFDFIQSEIFSYGIYFLVSLSLISFLYIAVKREKFLGYANAIRRRLWRFVAAFIVTVLIWFLILGLCYLSILSASGGMRGDELRFAIIAFSGAALSVLLPISGVANIGTHHAAWVAAMTIAGAGVTEAVASAILSHATMMIGTISLFVISLMLPRSPRYSKNDA